MTKFLFFFLITALVLPVSSFASEGVIPTLRQELKDKREEVKNEIEVKREENKDKNLENKRTKAQATMKRLRQGIVNRFENTLKHKTSIEARITKIGTTRDMTAAKAKLAEFSDTKYKADLATFDAKVTEILASSTPLKLTPELKTIAQTLQADIKTMRQILADTLRLIIKAR